MNKIFQFIVKRPWIAALSLALLIIGPLPYFKAPFVDTSLDRVVIKGDPEKAFYNETVKLFGIDKSANIYIEDPKLFTPKSLKRLQKLAWRLEKLPEAVRVDGLYNTTSFDNIDDALSIQPLFEDVPDSQEEVNRRIKVANRNPLIKGKLLDSERPAMLFNIRIKKRERKMKEIREEIESILKPYRSEFERVYQTGKPELDALIYKGMFHAQTVIFPIMILVIAFLIYLGTRMISAAVVPLIITIISVYWTIFSMNALDIPIHLLTSAIPAIIYILGSTEITHMMTSFREGREKGLSTKESIIFMGEKVGLAIFLTALTTSVGFFTICLNKITFLYEYGIIGGLALVFTFIASILYVPLHLLIFNKKEMIRRKEKDSGHLFKLQAKVLKVLYQLMIGRWIFPTLLLLISVNIYYACQIVIDVDTRATLRPSSEFTKQINHISQSFSGIQVIYLVFKDKSDAKFISPRPLKDMHDIQNELRKGDIFPNSLSFADQIALINREINPNQDELIVPNDKNAIYQYKLSLTREEMEPYISADYKTYNLVLMHNYSSTQGLEMALSKLDAVLEKKLKGKPYSYKYTSSNILNHRSAKTIVDSQVSSLSFMVLCIFLTISFLFKSIKVGLIAIPSNLIPISFLFGLMGILDIPLNIGTCIVASMTLGIAIDDTIHFFVRYAENLKENNDPFKATQRSVKDEIQPIMTTSFSLAIGLSFLAISDFVPMIHFGLLSSAVLIMAMISDLILTPAIITYFGVTDIIPFRDLLYYDIHSDRLNHHPLFNGLKESEIKQLINAAPVLTLKVGHPHSFRKEDHSSYLVLKGQLELKTKLIQNIDTGGLLTPRDYEEEHQIIAREMTQMMSLDPVHFERLNRVSPRIYSKFCDNIGRLEN